MRNGVPHYGLVPSHISFPMSKSIFSFCLFAIIVHSQTFSQCNFALSGYIFDEHTKENLAYTSLYIKELQVGVLADSLGFYQIDKLCSGDYTLELSHLDCGTKSFLLHISANTKQDFFLPHAIQQNKEVIINGKKIAPVATNAIQTLSEKALRESAGLSLGKTLEKITGVSTLQTGGTIAKPVIHGLHSSRILILNNGIRQEGQQWGNEHAPEIDPMVAKKLTVIKGADAVKYGADAMGGVILIEPGDLRDSAGIGGELTMAGFSNGKMGLVSGLIAQRLRGKFAPLAWQLQGTWKQGGNLQSPNYFLKNTGVKELNFSAMAAWQKSDYRFEAFFSQFYTKIGIFTGSHIGNLSDLQQVVSGEKQPIAANFSYQIDRPYQQIRHDLLKLKAYKRLPKMGRLYVVYALQVNAREEYDLLRFQSSSTAAGLKYKVTSQSIETNLEHKPMGNFTGSLGFSGMMQTNWVWGTRYLMPSYATYTGGIFAIERWKKGKWEIEGGLRLDYRQIAILQKDTAHFSLHYQSMSGNIGAIYRLSDKFLLRSNIGRAWRSPNVNELYSNGLHHGVAAIERGNKNLQAEKGYKAILSGDFTGSHLQVNITAYTHLIQHFIYLKPAKEIALTVQGAFPVFDYTQADASLTGLDYSIRYVFNPHISISSKGAMLRAWNLSQNEWLILMPSDRFEHGIKWENPTLGKFKKPYIAVSIQNVLKQIRVPENQDFAPPPSAYNLCNMEAGLEIPFSHFPLEISLSITNLLNQQYRDYMDRFRYFSDAMGRNVALRLHVAF